MPELTPEQRAEQLVLEHNITQNVGSKHESPGKAYKLITDAIRSAAEAARREEREQCAAECEKIIESAKEPLNDKFWSFFHDRPLREAATRIRARGENANG